jgi:hypothetical protein
MTTMRPKCQHGSSDEPGKTLCLLCRLEREEQMIREASRRWGCSPDDACEWVQAPHRSRTWTVWLDQGGTPRGFFDTFRRVREVLWDVLSHTRDYVEETGLPQTDEYRAVRYAIVFGDACVVLAPVEPMIVECVKDDLIETKELSSWWAAHLVACVTWVEWYRLQPPPVDILTIYRTIESANLNAWKKKAKAAAARQAAVTKAASEKGAAERAAFVEMVLKAT